MEIVITLPDGYAEILPNVQNGSAASKIILEAVKGGIVLPKNHGELADIDEDIAIDAIIHGVKIGQMVFEPLINGIHEGTVKKIIYDTGTLAFDKDAIGTSVFLTKEEAEKRMEELGKHIDGYY